MFTTFLDSSPKHEIQEPAGGALRLSSYDRHRDEIDEASHIRQTRVELALL